MDQLHHQHPPCTTATSPRVWPTSAESASTTLDGLWKGWTRSLMRPWAAPRGGGRCWLQGPLGQQCGEFRRRHVGRYLPGPGP